jgi:hypothetical protein
METHWMVSQVGLSCHQHAKGFARSHEVWDAAVDCRQVWFTSLGPWCPSAMVCRSPLPGVRKPAMVVVPD